MKKLIVLLLALVLVLSGCAQQEKKTENNNTAAPVVKTEIRVGSLKGPTTMGLVKLMEDDKAGTAANDYTFTMEGTADAIAPLLVRGEMDMALVPCNLASVLYNNTQGAVEILAVNTLGVLYVIESGEAIQSVADLKGKTVYSTGQGTTPEFALNYILQKNGIDPANDLTIEYRAEATEVAAAVIADQAAIAVLPQPYVTNVLAQNQNLRVALSLTDEWNKVGDGSAMITGVVVARREFVENNPDAVKAFLAEYAASTAYVNENPAEAAVWIGEAGIAGAAIAEKAIPACNIVCITGEEMKEKVSGYLAALYEQNPKAVGGNLPNADFYYLP
ncbi:MAG: ABC transporter substrate-binding protein [Clostridiales bacterium]|nr:ABC transporter substrate-binding protein [Clostridiales bacterium]